MLSHLNAETAYIAIFVFFFYGSLELTYVLTVLLTYYFFSIRDPSGAVSHALQPVQPMGHPHSTSIITGWYIIYIIHSFKMKMVQIRDGFSHKKLYFN